MSIETKVSINHDDMEFPIERVESVAFDEENIIINVNELTDSSMIAVRATRLVNSTAVIRGDEFDFMGCLIGDGSITLTNTTAKGK